MIFQTGSNDIARAVVGLRLGRRRILSKNLSPDAIISAFIGCSLVAWLADGEWSFSVLYTAEDMPEESAFVLIDLGAVVSMAINRALGDGGE